MVYLAKLPEFERMLNAKTEEEHIAAVFDLNELLLKAIQISDVAQWWRNSVKAKK